MSKKLLEESTIRSFMKLANLQPLSEKFITERYMEETSHGKDGKLEEEPVEEPVEETLEEDSLEEELQEEGEVQEEGKESEGRPASPKQKVAGVAKPGKMAAAKNAAGDAKLEPAQKSNHHSDKSDSIEAKQHSNAPKKNKSTFEVVSESLEEEMDAPEGGMEEEMDAPEGGGTPSDAAGEGGDHQAKMKDLIRGMLDTLKDMGAEYGMSMEISDEGAGGAPEAPESPESGEEDEGMMQEKLDEMVEKLTKRVAARLVKESKKKG